MRDTKLVVTAILGLAGFILFLGVSAAGRPEPGALEAPAAPWHWTGPGSALGAPTLYRDADGFAVIGDDGSGRLLVKCPVCRGSGMRLVHDGIFGLPTHGAPCDSCYGLGVLEGSRP